MTEHAILIASILMLILLFSKVPVFISLLSSTVVYFLLTPKVPTLIIAQRVIVGVESIPLLAVPFFICAGVFMNYSSITKRVMDFCGVLAGRMDGGLAQVNVILSLFMGGLTGSNLADAAMEAKMLVPEMERNGYSKAFSSVVTAASAIITPLIPPGIAMIIYGSVANVSIGKLFVAGIGPALLLTVAQMTLVKMLSVRRGYKKIREEKISRKEFLTSAKYALPALYLPIIIIGGIRIGLFTPTEAGAAAIIYSLFLGLIYKEVSWKNVGNAIKETIITTSSIMLIVAAASAFAWILTKERIPQTMTDFMVANISNKYVFLIIVNIFLLIVGMIVEGNALMIVLVPLLAPMAAAYGVDEIQFGMVVIFNMAIGCLTPPLGTLMFITCSITKCKIRDFIKECVPFYIMSFICLMLLTYVPAFTLFFVDLFY